MKNKVKVDLITGFLGAGKTTLVLNFLQELKGKEKVAVLVNEIGQIGLDGDIIKTELLEVLELVQGCICCSLRGNFIDGVMQIYETYKPERLIVEPTGMATPSEIINLLKYDLNKIANISSVTGVVDAAAFFKEQTNFGNFYASQIKVPDTILINKSDLVSKEELESIFWAIKEINPNANTIATTYCDIEIPLILNTPWDDKDVAIESKSSPHIDIFSWKDKGDFDEEKLFNFTEDLRDGKYGRIYRAKGFFRLPNKMVHIDWVMDMINYKEHENFNSYSVLTVLGDVIYKDKINDVLKSCLHKEKV